MSMESLRISTFVVAQEAGIFSDIANYIRNRIPAIIRDFTGVAAGLQGTIASATEQGREVKIELEKNQKKFLKKIEDIPFAKIREYPAYIPEGMSVGYATYLDDLNGMLGYSANTLEELNAFYVFLGKLISDKEFERNVDYIRTKALKLRQERDDFMKNRNKCFAGGSDTTVRTIGDVVGSNGEWQYIFASCNTISRNAENTKPTAVFEKMKECVKLLGIIEKRVIDNGMKDATPEVISNLADYVYSVAQALEIFSVTHYRVLVIESMINKTIDEFLKK